METNYRLIPEQPEQEFFSQLELELAGFRRRGCTMVRWHGGFEDRYQQVHGDLFAYEGRFDVREERRNET